jgi:hypothetical protein
VCQVVPGGDCGEWPQIVFPGRPLRVRRRGCLFARRYPRKLVLWKSFVLCRRKSASNVVLRAGPASVWRQRTVVVSAQEIPFATETWRGVVCWRGGRFRGWRGGGWGWCCCGGGGGGSESGKWLAGWCSGRAVLAAGNLREMLAVLRRFVERDTRAKAPSGGARSSPPVLLHLHYTSTSKGGAWGGVSFFVFFLHGNARETLIPLVAHPPNNHAT